MAKESKLRIYLGTQIIDGKCVSCLTASLSKKSAVKIFNSSTFFTQEFIDTLKIKNEANLNNEIYKLALKFPEKIFIKNCQEEIEKYRLFIDENKYHSSSTLITTFEQKIKFLDAAISNKVKFIKIRLKDEIVLKHGIAADLYLDIRFKDTIKQFFFIPYAEKINNNFQHRAIETNHEFSYILNEMADVYNEIIIPYTKKKALEFIEQI